MPPYPVRQASQSNESDIARCHVYRFYRYTSAETRQKTSLEVFGPYIHTYKFDEAVDDNVVLDLRYEARDIDQRITDQDSIDEWFEAETRGLNDLAKIELKKRWGTLKQVLSSKSRLD